MSREKIALKPLSVTSQPITSRLSGQVCSPEATMAGPSPPVESSAPDAPSPKGERAKFDRKDQYHLAGGCRGLARGARQTDDTAGTAQPKYRQSAHRSPQ